MNNGCPQCEKIEGLCINCQIEQADSDLLRAMNRLEELKAKKEKNELSGNTKD